MEQLNLYKLFVDYGRSGEIEGLFAATEEDITAAYGKQVYLGGALGKHSEVYFYLDPEMIERLEVSPEAVAQIVKAVGHGSISGYNPLEYIEEEEGNDE